MSEDPSTVRPPAVEPTLASEGADARPSRRRFLLQASAIGASFVACGRSDTGGGGAAHTDTTTTPAPATAATPSHSAQNADSRIDTSLHHAMPGATKAPSGTSADRVAYHRFDPALPPLSASRTTRLHFTAKETAVRIADGTVVAAWTFDGDIPGPIVHVRQGDTVEFTLTNEGSIPHSMDFHAAQIDPKTAFRSVLPGQSTTYTFKPKYAGVFLYHCGTAPVLTPLPPAREFVLIQSEFYLGTPQNGISPFDYTKMLSTLPDLFAFNGRPGQYQTEPIRVKRGDRVRFFVANAGPTHPCAFHVVGEQFDTVYLGAPPSSAIHGVQTFGVPAGGGMIFELTADIPGEFVFVNHAFGHGQKGAIGVLVVEP
jgi:nitrite reductase (NO-forming)